jgi:hypothetical protein
MEIGGFEFQSREERKETTLQTLLTVLGAGRKQDLPLNFPLFFLMEEDEAHSVFVDRRLGATRDLFRQQDLYRRQYATFSPLTALQFLSPVLCATGAEAGWSMAADLERHRRRLVKLMNRHESAQIVRKETPLAGRRVWDTIEPFQPDPPAPFTAASEYRRESFIVIAWFLMLGGLALSLALIPRREESE